MRIGLYQIYDRKAELAQGTIMKHKATGAAVRDFYTIFNHQGTLPAMHPEDFELQKIGEQEEDTGELFPIPPQIITTGGEWLEKTTKDRQIQEARATAG